MEILNPNEVGAALGYTLLALGGVSSVILAYFNRKKEGTKPSVPEERKPNAHELRAKLEEFHSRFDTLTTQLRTLQSSFDENIVSFRQRLNLIDKAIAGLTDLAEDIRKYKEK